MQLLRDATNGVTPDRCARELLAAVPLVMRYLRAQMRGRRGAELSVPQFRALFLIRDNHGTSVSDIAEHLGLSLPGASRTVDMLVKRGLVGRRAHTDDRRRLSLSLTARGRAALREAVDAAEQALARQFEPMSSQQLARLSRAMRLLAQTFALGRRPEAIRTPAAGRGVLT